MSFLLYNFCSFFSRLHFFLLTIYFWLRITLWQSIFELFIIITLSVWQWILTVCDGFIFYSYVSRQKSKSLKNLWCTIPFLYIVISIIIAITYDYYCWFSQMIWWWWRCLIWWRALLRNYYQGWIDHAQLNE